MQADVCAALGNLELLRERREAAAEWFEQAAELSTRPLLRRWLKEHAERVRAGASAPR